MKLKAYCLAAIGIWSTWGGGISYSQTHDLPKYTGTIGKYNIEFEFLSIGWIDGVITGRYKYANKDKYLQLEGVMLGNCLQLTEYYGDESTGDFYLTFGEENTISGKWIAAPKSYDVNLSYVSGDLSTLTCKSPEDYASCINTEVTGTYVNEFWFLNDYFFSEDNVQMEIGFNGGFLMIEDTRDDSINFKVEVICGPTYHIAYAEGRCKKKGDKAKYVIPFEPYGDETEGTDCVIEFEFSYGTVSVTANGSFTCGFGARAYLDHTFTKVGNEINFDPDVPLEDLYCTD
jgi:hypothetical protein